MEVPDALGDTDRVFDDLIQSERAFAHLGLETVVEFLHQHVEAAILLGLTGAIDSANVFALKLKHDLDFSHECRLQE